MVGLFGTTLGPMACAGTEGNAGVVIGKRIGVTMYARRMAAMVVRPYDAERDEEALFGIYSLTYNDGMPFAPEDRHPRFTRPYVIERDGRVLGGLGILDFTCTRGPALLKCGAIAAVAVDPQCRRGGIGSAMMAQIVRLMRSDGIHLSSLYAFRETFYRKAGYEVCGRRVQVVCPTHRLPKAASELDVRRLTPADWRQIAPCYERYAHARSGMNVRSESMWTRFLGEHKPNTIYAAGDPVEGYVAISHQTAFWEQQQITEVVWSTPRGYQACLEILRMLGINKSSLSWYEPSDGPFLSRYMDQGIETKLVRPIMFRLNDVPASMRLLRTDSTGCFGMRVLDDVVDENAGFWTVRFSPTGVEVEAGGEPDFTIDVRQLVQAFLGEPSFEDLVRTGLVDVLSEEGVKSASKLFTRLPTYCGDFF